MKNLDYLYDPEIGRIGLDKIIGQERIELVYFLCFKNEIHPHDVSAILDRKGIAIRTGAHCAQPLMEFFGITASCRASLALYNTVEEIDKFMNLKFV